MIGGMSWESSLEYYRIINEKIKKELGNLHSAKSIMYSVDFQEIEDLQHKNKWNELSIIMTNAAQSLEKAGADLIILCTNTMHIVADDVQKNIKIPFLHIADASAQIILGKGLQKLGLLGTKFTMEQDFYKYRLKQEYGFNVIVPKEKDRNLIHKVIYGELCLGKTLDTSKKEFLRIINDLIQLGAEGIILGCTEIPLLIKQSDVSVPIFDTTKIHAEYAVTKSLEN